MWFVEFQIQDKIYEIKENKCNQSSEQKKLMRECDVAKAENPVVSISVIIKMTQCSDKNRMIVQVEVEQRFSNP